MPLMFGQTFVMDVAKLSISGWHPGPCFSPWFLYWSTLVHIADGREAAPKGGVSAPIFRKTACAHFNGPVRALRVCRGGASHACRWPCQGKEKAGWAQAHQMHALCYKEGQ